MKLFKTIIKICINNFRKWISNYRVWCIAILLIIIMHMFTKDVTQFSNQMKIKVTPWLFPFLFNQKYIKLLFLFPLVLLFCDAPFIDANQPYVIIRAGRIPWCMGQILYIAFASAVYFMYIIIISIVINLPYMQFSSDWGKIIGTLAKTDASSQVGIKLIFFKNILDYFSPMQAMWFTFFLLWLTGIFIGLIIFAVNSLINSRAFGILSASALLIFDATLNNRKDLIRFSPVSWSNLSNIRITGVSMLPTIEYIYISFAILISVLIAVSLIAIRKKSIQVLPPI